MKTYQKIYNLVKKIPKGQVSTYGQIGQLLNINPRVIGWALNRLAKVKRKDVRAGLKSAPTVPWQRVINSKGGISTNRLMNIPLGLQKNLLKREGIHFSKDEKINLSKYLWRGKL